MHAGSLHSQQHHDSRPQRVSRVTARQATLHCLTGCAIGEVLGMVIGTSLGLHDAATVALAIAPAFVLGYAPTVCVVLRGGLPLRRAVQVALAADTVSILVVELVDNAVILAVPGAEGGRARRLPLVGIAGRGARRRLRRHAAGQPRSHEPRQGHAVVHGMH